MANIGPKLSIDGYADYKKQIDNMIAQASSLDAEMRLVASSFDENTSAQEQSAKKGEILQKQLDAQQERVRLLAEVVDKATAEYGENSTEVLKWKTVLADAQTKANSLEAEIRGNTEALEQDENASKQAAEETKNFGDKTKDAEGKAGAFGKAVASAASWLKNIAGAALDAGKAVVSFVTDSAKKGAAFADNIQSLATSTGMSTQALQEYQYMAELTDVPLETITKSMAKLINKMDDARNGSKTAEEAFQKLGVAVTDENGQLRSNEEVFADVIDALGGIENATERDAVSMDLFGKSAQDLNGLIKQGGDGIAAFRQEAHDMGYVLEDDLLDSLGGMDDAFQRLELVGQSLTNQLALAVAPAVTEAGDAFLGFAQKAIGAVSAASDALATDNMQEGVEILVDFAGQAVDELIEALPELLDIGGFIIGAIGGTLLDNMPKLLDTGTRLITALCETFGDEEATAAITKGAVGIVSDLARWLARNAPQLMIAATSLLLGLVDGLTDPDSLVDLFEAALALIIALADGLLASLPKVVEKGPVIVKNFMKALTDAGPLLIDSGAELISKLVKGIVDHGWDMNVAGYKMIGEFLKGLWDMSAALDAEVKAMVMAPFANLWAWAKKSAKDMMDGFIQGIKDNPITNAVEGVAKGIKDFLGFSEPDRGPLSNFHTFAPDMMDLFMKGIRDSVPELEATVSHAFDLEPYIRSGRPAGAAVTNTHGDIHITVYGAEGQDVEELAHIIKQDIVDEWDDEEAVFA